MGVPAILHDEEEQIFYDLNGIMKNNDVFTF